MLKKALIIFTLPVYIFGNIINGVSVVINDDAITLYDIEKASLQKKIPKAKALSILIDEHLYTQELDRFNIIISKEDIEMYLGKLAHTNNMTLDNFKSTIAQRRNYNVFIQDIEKRLASQQLIKKVAMGKLPIATDEDMLLYYENNMEQFRVSENSINIAPFESIKNKIFNILMSQREQDFLKEYFETLKITADIKIIR